MQICSSERGAGPAVRTCPAPGRKSATEHRLPMAFSVTLCLLAALLCVHMQTIRENTVPASWQSAHTAPSAPWQQSSIVHRRPLFLLASGSGEARWSPPPASGWVAATPAALRPATLCKPGLLLLLLLLLLTPRRQGRLARNVRRQLAAALRRRQPRAAQAGSGRERKAPASMVECVNQAAPCGRSGGGTALAATTFANVAGIDEVRADLEEMVQFLRSPHKFERLGAHIPRGALLVGAPGTGKTLLARAVAGEADVPFFHISASELVEIFVGVGASRVRALFQKARHLAPAVIFIDEIDAVGRKRTGKAAGHEEREQTLNQLLVEMDGFCRSQAVVVLAATNRVDILDPALLRPGRFDRHISVPLPDCAGRQTILALHAARVPLHQEVALSHLARLTVGMSGADLASLVNEAALCAARQNLQEVDHACFEQALARMQLGAQRPLVLSEAEQRVIACHEGGHALVAYYLPEAGSVNGVTILPRGQSLGVTHLVDQEERSNYSRQALMARIAVGLGGRAAEELIVGREHVTIGAENDLRTTTSLAHRMVTRWGMGQEIAATVAGSQAVEAVRRSEPCGYPAQTQVLAVDACGRLVSAGHSQLRRASAFTTARATSGMSCNMAMQVDREISKILDEGYAMARQILQEHAEQLQVLVRALVDREQLKRAEFEALMSQGPDGELL